MNRPKLNHSKAPRYNEPGGKEYWFAVGLYERDQAVYDAVHLEKEDLYAVETAGENLSNYIIANIHDPDFMVTILDMVNEFDFRF